jgi:hypothetical protein
MVAELADLLDDFPGPANQTRCFTHVLNLVVKSIIQQFDSPKSNLNKATNELLSLAGNIEIDEGLERREGDEGEDEDDNIGGWIDKHTLMAQEEVEELDASVEPLRLLLTKVR